MPKDISVSVIIYNDYKTVKDAIHSLEQFTGRQLSKSVYIVDNSTGISLKGEQNLFLNYLNQYDDISYINSDNNLGFGKGHNLVLDKLDSRYHVIMNPDILFCEDALSKIIKWMDDNPDVGMVIPHITDIDGNRQEVYRKELTVFDMFNRMFLKNAFKKRAAEHTLQNMDYSQPFDVPFGQGSFLVIRTDLFKKLGGFDPNFFMYVEDADLCKRVNQVSKLKYYPGAKIIHKWEKGSHHNLKLFKMHLTSSFYYFKKWGLKIF